MFRVPQTRTNLRVSTFENMCAVRLFKYPELFGFHCHITRAVSDDSLVPQTQLHCTDLRVSTFVFVRTDMLTPSCENVFSYVEHETGPLDFGGF